MEEANFSIDFDVVLDMLEERLPMIPGKPEVQQVNPPPYQVQKDKSIFVTFGKLYPREREDKKKKGGAKKAPARKKDERPPKPIKWDGPPKPHQPDTMELLN